MTITFPLADNTESICVTDISCQLMKLITRIVQVATLLLPPVTQLSTLNTQLYSHAESADFRRGRMAARASASGVI